MIKTITKIVAGITAAAALLLTAGCKNQLDYVDNTTALNQMYIDGFKVTGLDDAYNGAKIELVVVESETKEKVYGEAKVADSYTDKDGKVVGYNKGTVYKKFASPVLYNGDLLNTSKFECYLKITSDSGFDNYANDNVSTIKALSADGTKFENAVLSIPTSPAGTSYAELASRWVDVVVADGVATFSFVKSEKEPINVTMACITMDIHEMSEADVASSEAITITTSAKSAKAKYTLKFTGLTEDQIGLPVQLAGSLIGVDDIKSGEIGDLWDGGPADLVSAADQEKSSLNQVIAKADADDSEKGLKKDEIYVQWTFYGDTPDWASEGFKGPAIKVYKPGKKDQVFFLKTGAAGNFFFPAYTYGKDVSVTIDVSKIAGSEGKVEKSDPVYKPAKFSISGLRLNNAPTYKFNTVYGLSLDQPYYFVALDNAPGLGLWLPGHQWGVGSVGYTEADLVNGDFTYAFETAVEFTPQAKEFEVGLRLGRSTIEKVKLQTRVATDEDDDDVQDEDDDGNLLWTYTDSSIEVPKITYMTYKVVDGKLVEDKAIALMAYTTSDVLAGGYDVITDNNVVFCYYTGNVETKVLTMSNISTESSFFGLADEIKSRTEVPAGTTGVYSYELTYGFTWDGDDSTKNDGANANVCVTKKLSTADYADGNYVLVMEYAGYRKTAAYLVETGYKNSTFLDSVSFSWTRIRYVNAPTIGAAGYLAFCAAKLPNNVWDDGTTNKVTSLNADGEAVLTFAAPETVTGEAASAFEGIQVLNPASAGAFWADDSKAENGSKQAVLYSGMSGNYELVIDGETHAQYFKSFASTKWSDSFLSSIF